MIYSDLYTGQKQKIPTIVGVLLVVFVSVFFLSLTNRTALPSRASQTSLKRIELTNLSPIQASIYWQTQEKEAGWLLYGESQDKLTNIALDDRDVKEKKGNYLNHYATLRNLKPGRLYFYAVVSSDKKLIKPDGGYFSFQTPESSSTPTKLNPASGKVLQANLEPLSNAIVLITINDSTIALSTISKDSGEWLVPLNSFYEKNSYKEKIFTGEEQVKVEFLSEDNQISTIITNLNNLASSSETTVIGKNYNFLQGDSVLSATTTKLGLSETDTIQIIYPKEGALIPGRKPLIKGIALPSADISITINSAKAYSANVKADKSGNWNYLIPENLELGVHTITIKTKDEKGQDKIIVRQFTIVANEGIEGKVLGTASGEPTITVQPTLTTSVYSTPTIYISPTASPPVSGTFNIFPIISSLSLIIVGGGILLAF